MSESMLVERHGNRTIASPLDGSHESLHVDGWFERRRSSTIVLA
jgi:hypothetical protein